VTKVKRRAAKRPTVRTVQITVSEGDFAGWEATARADFPAGILADLQSGDLGRIIDALDTIVLDHNFPDSSDEVAATMREVDPYDGLLALSNEIFDAIGKLPNR
jgi:hypothetical protein